MRFTIKSNSGKLDTITNTIVEKMIIKEIITEKLMLLLILVLPNNTNATTIIALQVMIKMLKEKGASLALI